MHICMYVPMYELTYLCMYICMYVCMYAGSREPRAGGSWELGDGGCREPRGDQEPGANGWEPGAESWELGAGSREPGAVGSWEPGAGGLEPVTGTWGARDLGAGAGIRGEPGSAGSRDFRRTDLGPRAQAQHKQTKASTAKLHLRDVTTSS